MVKLYMIDVIYEVIMRKLRASIGPSLLKMERLKYACFSTFHVPKSRNFWDLNVSTYIECLMCVSSNTLIQAMCCLL